MFLTRSVNAKNIRKIPKEKIFQDFSLGSGKLFLLKKTNERKNCSKCLGTCKPISFLKKAQLFAISFWDDLAFNDFSISGDICARNIVQ